MKIVIKTILAVSIIVGLCLILVAMIIGRPESGDKETVTKLIQPQVAVQDQTSWPMFRGGQSLLGTAAGTLPDSMVFIWKFKTGAELRGFSKREGNVDVRDR